MEWIERALAIAPDDPVAREYAACAHARAGQKAAALDCLQQALVFGYRHCAWIEHEPDFELLRGDPRFRAMLRRRARKVPVSL